MLDDSELYSLLHLWSGQRNKLIRHILLSYYLPLLPFWSSLITSFSLLCPCFASCMGQFAQPHRIPAQVIRPLPCPLRFVYPILCIKPTFLASGDMFWDKLYVSSVTCLSPILQSPAVTFLFIDLSLCMQSFSCHNTALLAVPSTSQDGATVSPLRLIPVLH